jgi:hypothetical protein
VRGAKPRGTLECPPGFKLDEKQDFCVPESPLSQAVDESGQALRLTKKMERCITTVKESLRRKNPKAKEQDIKSSAIAICRSSLKQ